MLPRFELLTPTTIAEASAFYTSHSPNAHFLAGGTELFVRMYEKRFTPEYLIDLTGISSLKGLELLPDGSIKIGALTTFSEVMKNEHIRRTYPILIDASERMGSLQIRNIATIGGNLCNAVPSADSAPALMVCNAQLEISDGKKSRSLPLDQFLLGVRKIALEPGELLSSVIIPPRGKRFTAAYYKFSKRKAMDLALLGVAVSMTLENNNISDVGIALATAAPTAIRVRETEDFLRGKPFSDKLIAEAAELTASVVKPRSSYRTTEKYRRKLIQSLIPRTFAIALKRLDG